MIFFTSLGTAGVRLGASAKSLDVIGGLSARSARIIYSLPPHFGFLTSAMTVTKRLVIDSFSSCQWSRRKRLPTHAMFTRASLISMPASCFVISIARRKEEQRQASGQDFFGNVVMYCCLNVVTTTRSKLTAKSTGKVHMVYALLSNRP